MFETIKRAIKTPEIRKRLMYTLILIVIFRLGCYITVPGVNEIALTEFMSINSTKGIASIQNLISGDAFERLSIFAMGVGPYITASIIIQLLTFVIPALEKKAKEGGEEGRRQINKYTKFATLILAIIEAVGIYALYSKSGFFINPSFFTAFVITISLVAGASLLMWIGDQITAKGIGNGISMVIFIGIVTRLPDVAILLYDKTFPLLSGARTFSLGGFGISLAVIIGAIALIAGVVWVQEAERRVPVQYAKKVVGRKMYGGQSTHIPLKLAAAGVMPVIFAMTFMSFPAMIISIFNHNPETLTGILKHLYYISIAGNAATPNIVYSIINAVIYLLLIVGFTFFYTLMTFNPVEIANNIKRNGGFIPGIRAGKPTADYLSGILSKITWFGSFFLAAIAILPILVQFTGLNIQFGGTAILIVVGVALETVKQLESQLAMRNYKGFLE